MPHTPSSIVASLNIISIFTGETLLLFTHCCTSAESACCSAASALRRRLLPPAHLLNESQCTYHHKHSFLSYFLTNFIKCYNFRSLIVFWTFVPMTLVKLVTLKRMDSSSLVHSLSVSPQRALLPHCLLRRPSQRAYSLPLYSISIQRSQLFLPALTRWVVVIWQTARNRKIFLYIKFPAGIW